MLNGTVTLNKTHLILSIFTSGLLKNNSSFHRVRYESGVALHAVLLEADGQLFSRRSAPSPLSSPHIPVLSLAKHVCFQEGPSLSCAGQNRARVSSARHLCVMAKFQLYFPCLLTLSFPLSVCLLLSLTY